VFWWRALHLALLAVPALQALFGCTCFLTLWQAMLEQEVGARASQEPLIARLVERNLLAAADLVLRCALCRDMDLCLGTLVAGAAGATLAHYLNGVPGNGGKIQEKAQDYSGFVLKPQTPTPKLAQPSRAPARTEARSGRRLPAALSPSAFRMFPSVPAKARSIFSTR